MSATAPPVDDLRAALSLVPNAAFDVLVREEWRRRGMAPAKISAADVQLMRDLHECANPRLTWRQVWERFPGYNPRTIRAILYYERRLNVTPVGAS